MAVVFAGRIYDTTEKLPREELFGMSSQLKSTATSISRSIAEGSACSSAKDFARYLEVAIGSIFDIITALVIARNRNFLTADHYQDIYADAEILTKKIAAFRKNVVPNRVGEF